MAPSSAARGQRTRSRSRRTRTRTRTCTHTRTRTRTRNHVGVAAPAALWFSGLLASGLVAVLMLASPSPMSACQAMCQVSQTKMLS